MKDVRDKIEAILDGIHFEDKTYRQLRHSLLVAVTELDFLGNKRETCRHYECCANCGEIYSAQEALEKIESILRGVEVSDALNLGNNLEESQKLVIMWHVSWFNLNEKYKEVEKENQALKEKLRIAKEALEFYASIGVWGIDIPGRTTAIDPSDQEYCNGVGQIRGGKRARQVLKDIEK